MKRKESAGSKRESIRSPQSTGLGTPDLSSGRRRETELSERRRSSGVRNAEGLLCISQRRPSNGCHVFFDVGAEFAGEHRAVFIQIGGAAKAFEKEIGKEAMLTWLIGLRFLQGRVPHHQHHPLLLAVGILRDPPRGGHASGIRTGRWFQGQVQHHDRLFDRRIRERPLQPGQGKGASRSGYRRIIRQQGDRSRVMIHNGSAGDIHVGRGVRSSLLR